MLHCLSYPGVAHIFTVIFLNSPTISRCGIKFIFKPVCALHVWIPAMALWYSLSIFLSECTFTWCTVEYITSINVHFWINLFISLSAWTVSFSQCSQNHLTSLSPSLSRFSDFKIEPFKWPLFSYGLMVPDIIFVWNCMSFLCWEIFLCAHHSSQRWIIWYLNHEPCIDSALWI